MSKDAIKDSLATHAVTNYLSAGYQGRFTYLNILDQLGYPDIKRETIPETREALDLIAHWTEELWSGQDLFQASWTSADTPDSKKALALLAQLKPELNELAKQISTIFESQNFAEKDDNITILAAAFGRFAYAREHYIKGFLEFGNRFKMVHETNRYANLLPPAIEDVKLTHTILNIIKARTSLADPKFIAGIKERCVPLTSVFNTHAHDINQLLATYQGGFNFEKGDFSPEETANWRSIEVGAVAAGYWRANGFSASDAEPWLKGNIANPPTAAAWKQFGFDAQSALQWVKGNFPPAYAKLWSSAGYDANQSRSYIEQGITEPSKVP